MRLRRFPGLVPSSNDVASDLVCPPYDTVSEDEARAILARQSSSFIGVVRPDAALPPGSPATSVYAEAARRFDHLIEIGSLVRPEEPAIYLYELDDKRATAMNAAKRQPQRGLVALVSVHDYDAGVIKRHEKTRPDKVDDRTHLAETICAQTGPVFLTYRGVSAIDEITTHIAQVTKATFDVVADDQVRHRVWKIDAENSSELIECFRQNVNACYIADGHHRAASAARVARKRLQSRLEKNGHAQDQEDMEESWFLGVLFAEHQLEILPYNRVVHDLLGNSAEEFLFKLATVGQISKLSRTPTEWPQEKRTVHVFVGNSWYELKLREELYRNRERSENLDCGILQVAVLEPLLGIHDPRTSSRIEFVGGIRGHAYLEDRVRVQGMGVAFAMHAVCTSDLMLVSDENCLMPPKSTWFEPKLRSGFFVHTLA